MANLIFNHTSGMWVNLDKPGGRVYFVGGGSVAAKGRTGSGLSASNDNDGLTPERPLSTIQSAIGDCTAGRGDTVALLPGSIAITAAITIGKDDMTLTAAQPVGARQYPNVTISTATDVSMLEINANNVTVDSIRFDDNVTAATAGTATIDVNTSDTGEDFSGVRILNCWIDQAGMTDSDRDGITLGTDASDGALAALVEGCTIIEAGRNAILINVGSEHSTVRNCKIYDVADVTLNGVKVLATSCTIEYCDMLTSGADGSGCIYNGVAAARMVANNNNLAAWGADTACIIVANTATQRTHNNHMTATAAGNFVNYITDNTTPSADTGFENVFAATSGITVFSNSTDDGS